MSHAGKQGTVKEIPRRKWRQVRNPSQTLVSKYQQ